VQITALPEADPITSAQAINRRGAEDALGRARRAHRALGCAAFMQDAAADRPETLPRDRAGSRDGGAHAVPEPGEDPPDRIRVRAAGVGAMRKGPGWGVSAARWTTRFADGPAPRAALVAEVVRDHQVARAQGRGAQLIVVGRAAEDAGRIGPERPRRWSCAGVL
jgi:hypothetical protein